MSVATAAQTIGPYWHLIEHAEMADLTRFGAAGDFAQAYAAWLSASEKHRYRLPTAGELRAQATSPISAWLTLCGNPACTQRMASGKPQALDASRGYNDVGIRLVREG